MRNKALTILATIPLVMQLSGCASSPAQTDVRARQVVTRPEATKATSAADQKPSAADQKPSAADQKPSAVEQKPKGFDENVALGDAAWQAQDFDRAVYYYVQAMGKSSPDAATLAKIGTIEDGRGNSALAETAFQMAHSADPQEPRIAERLARLYLQRGNVDGAAQIYTQVLARDSHRTRALDGMGEVYLARADYAQSIRYFDYALAAEKPDRSAVLTHRGHAKLRLNNLYGAEADLRTALSVSRRDDTWRYLAEVQVLRGDTGAALHSLLNIMDTAQAFNQMGVVFMSQKNYREAREYFDKAIKSSAAWFEEAHKNLAQTDEYLKKSAG